MKEASCVNKKISQDPREPGYLYILTNPSMPGLIKMGKTSRRPEDRLQELSSATGVPTPFDLRHCVFVEDAGASEKKLHTLWEKQGHRTSNGREFFRLPIEKAISDVNLEKTSITSSKQELRTLLDRGFNLMKGSEETLKDLPQALQYFEQASAKGSALGAYWAGRVSEGMVKEQPRRASTWRQRALNHYQVAKNKGVIKAFARSSWIYARVKQYEQAEIAWLMWLDAVSEKNELDDESARWLSQYLEKTPLSKIDLRHPVWRVHYFNLLKMCRHLQLSQAIVHLKKTKKGFGRVMFFFSVGLALMMLVWTAHYLGYV